MVGVGGLRQGSNSRLQVDGLSFPLIFPFNGLCVQSGQCVQFNGETLLVARQNWNYLQHQQQSIPLLFLYILSKKQYVKEYFH